MSVCPQSFRRRFGSLICGALALGVVMSASVEADAAPRVLRPGTHPWWFQGGLGPSVGVTGTNGGNLPTQFMLTQEIGGHFTNDFEGPGLVAHFAEAFGGRGRGNNNFRFTTGPRFYYDIQVNDSYGIYIAPYGQIGYTFVENDFHFFNLQFGATAHIILADRAVVGAQLVNFDINVGDFWFMNYTMQFFGGVSW
jgi:hypothetical protein